MPSSAAFDSFSSFVRAATIIAAAVASLLVLGVGSAAAAPPSAGQPDFGPNVLIFDPSMSTSQIQATVDAIAAQQVPNQFGSQRYAHLFKPGTYGTLQDPPGRPQWGEAVRQPARLPDQERRIRRRAGPRPLFNRAPPRGGAPRGTRRAVWGSPHASFGSLTETRRRNPSRYGLSVLCCARFLAPGPSRRCMAMAS